METTTLQNDQIKRCFECGQPASHEHHVIPRSLGGTKTVPLCNSCHPKAHGKHGYWKTGELIKQKLNQLKTTGKYIGGALPYGKKLENGTLVNCPVEQANIELMVKWRQDGETYFNICTRLNELGIPTKQKGKHWRAFNVQQIVSRFIQEPFTRQELIRKTKQTRLKNGQFIGGCAPYGYMVQDKRLVPVHHERDIIKQMHVMRLMGASLQGIAKALNESGVVTRRKAKWRHATIKLIMQAKSADRRRRTRAPF